VPAHLFDRSRIPAGVFREAALDHLDQLVEHVRSHCTPTVALVDGDQPRSPSVVQVLSQSHLHRCLEQTEAAALLCNNHRWLSAITIARGLMETIAAYYHLAQKIENVVRGGSIEAIYDALIAAGFATRDRDLIAHAATDAVRATNILTQIDALTAHRESARRDYDILSEHAHPNALGVLLFFSRQDTSQNVVSFRTEGWTADEAFKWTGAAIFVLHAALDAERKLETAAEVIARIEQRGSAN
jgi:hypothetical protein